MLVYLFGERDYMEALMLALPISMVVPLNIMYNPQSYARNNVSDRQVKVICGIIIGLITVAVFLCSIFLSGRSLSVSAVYALSMPAVGFLFFGLWYGIIRRATTRGKKE